MQSVTLYTFPRLVMEDQNHPKTIPCRHCIKTCGRPDHQLNMEIIIQDGLVKRNHYYRMCRKLRDSNLIFVNMLWICQNWACTGPILPGSIGSALASFWHIRECLQGWHYPWLLSFLAIILMKSAVPEPGQYWPDGNSIWLVPIPFWHIKACKQR